MSRSHTAWLKHTGTSSRQDSIRPKENDGFLHEGSNPEKGKENLLFSMTETQRCQVSPGCIGIKVSCRALCGRDTPPPRVCRAPSGIILPPSTFGQTNISSTAIETSTLVPGMAKLKWSFISSLGFEILSHSSTHGRQNLLCFTF